MFREVGEIIARTFTSVGPGFEGAAGRVARSSLVEITFIKSDGAFVTGRP